MRNCKTLNWTASPLGLADLLCPFLFRNLDRSLGGAGSPSLEQKKAIQCQSEIAPDLRPSRKKIAYSKEWSSGYLLISNLRKSNGMGKNSPHSSPTDLPPRDSMGLGLDVN
jgi:hypothetical protein